ncbi:hypothetical protein D9757_003799 [Collybiopsis confluens]|uniref:Uncharacterized protein n=1 Tax=Collybiopsis confluens TaxID=2823264 RepID=A0A8H5HVI4_9AGAR|nr:hypothetical protein D9757_003799 [Collybiopsis confluens]
MHPISEQNQNPQRNKTTPTLPSHSPIHSPNSTPPLTQSTSGSNYSSNSFASTSQSPPLPFTPPSRYSRTHVSSFANQRAIANRSGARYPNNLALGRTPLHRRGTSQTYEPFEDLLREAGYKETRIFTPEIERTVPTDNQSNGSDGKSKVAGVVGFLSGLIPGSRSSSLQVESTEETKGSRYSPPGSPTLAARRNFGPKKEKEYHPSQESDEDATPRPLRTGGPLHLRPNDTSIHYTHNNHSYTTLSQSSSSKQMPPPLPPSHNNPPVSDSRPSRATAYLRHIASVPDIPGADLQRSQSPSESTRNRQMKRKSFNSGHYSDNDEDTDFNSRMKGVTEAMEKEKKIQIYLDRFQGPGWKPWPGRCY